jgi:hypothetical protein
MAEQLPPGAVKPGWTTTEFWQTVLVQVIAAIVALGTVFHTSFQLNGLQSVVPVAALLAAAIAQAFYAHSRSTVKSAAQGAATQVLLAGGSAVSANDSMNEPVPIIVNLTGVQPR